MEQFRLWGSSALWDGEEQFHARRMDAFVAGLVEAGKL
jgi:hypothetical protein